MWSSDIYRDQISILGLIASDASYKSGGFGPDSLLRTSPDSDPADEYPFYARILERASPVEDAASPMAYDAPVFPGEDGNLVLGVELKNWRQVEDPIEDLASGTAATIYRREYFEGEVAKSEYIVAFRGTDGRNGRDWFSNIQLGTDQWNALLERLYGANGIIRRLVSLDGSIPRMHFTGQSLGGALAQYAAYEYVRQRETENTALFDSRFSAERKQLVTLTSFNAFAAGLGLKKIYGQSFEPLQLAGIPTAHYSIENEIIHRVGGSFVGNELQHGFLNAIDEGQSNLYHFASWRHWKDDIERRDEQGYLGLVEGHRIESGFYQGLDRYNTTFSSAVQGGDPSGLVKIDRLQQVGEIFARFLGGEQSGEFASWARVTAALAMGAVFGGVGDVARLLQLVGNSLYKSDDINFLTKTVIASGIGSRLTASSLTLLAKPAIAIAGAASLVAAIADLFQKGNEARQATSLMNLNIADDKQLEELVTVGVNDGTKVGSADSLLRLSLLLDYLQPDLLVTSPLREQKDAFDAIADDPLSFTTTLYGAGDGYEDTFAFLTNEAIERAYSGDNQKAIEFGRALVESGTNEATRIAGVDTTVRADLDEHVADYIADLAAAVGKLGGERLPGHAGDTPIVLTPVTSYQEFRAVIGELRDRFGDFDSYSLFGLSEDAAPELEAKLDQARASLISAGQAPEIRVFAAKPTNPFDDAAFEPGSALQAAGEIADGSAGTYVLFLAYEAAEGGQKVRLDLGGVATDQLTVWSEGAVVPVADGAFILTVAEGRRQVAFVLEVAEELTAGGSVSISATLVNEDGVATHQTDIEANIALALKDKTFEEVFEAATATDLARADRISGYFSDGGTENDPTLVRTRLVGTGAGDLFVGDHASESIIGGHGNDFILEGAGAGTGTYTEGDAVDAGAGNDFITGHLAARIDAGVGDDFVNANFSIRLAASRLSTPSGTLSEFPAEIYADIAPFIRVVSTGAGPVTNPDGSLDFTYSRDFGNSNLGNPVAGVSAKMGVTSTGAGTEIRRTSDGGATFQFTTFNGVANITYLGASSPLTYGVAFESSAALGNLDAVLIDGGEGNDQLAGAGGFDFIDGGVGNDRIAGFGGDDTLEGGDGSDQVIAGGGDDYVDGGTGDDRLWGEGGHDGLWGGTGNDIIFGDTLSIPAALQGNDYLDGGAGNDELNGGGGNDELFGGDGNDIADGGDGDDYIDGEAGNDTLLGGAGNNELLGGEGNDIITAGHGADLLDGESGNDQVDGGAGNDRLLGGQGNDNLIGGLDDDVLDGASGADHLAGGAGNDTLMGAAGSDKLLGGEGSDRLAGGAGDNVLSGDAGDDIYILALGDGLSIVDDLVGQNRIVYGYGIFADDVVAAYTDPASGPQDLVLTYGAGGRVAIRGAGMAMTTLEFADGTPLPLAQFVSANLAPAFERRSNVLIGTVGNDVLADTSGADVVAYGLEGSDTITTGSGADTFHGGHGNDTLNGAAGDDVYRFSPGDGQDRVTDVDGTPGNRDALVYASDILPAEILVSRSNSDLVLMLAGTTDRVTVVNYFQNDGATPSSVEEIRFVSDGTVWDVKTVKIKAITGTAGNDGLTGYASDDAINGLAGNDALQGAAGADVLDGGPGNDTLRGGSGDDAYVFGYGYGSDRIDEESASVATSGVDAIVVSAEIAPSQVVLRRITSQNLELRLNDGSSLVIERQFTAEGALGEPIEQIRFGSDGTIWDLQTIMQIITTPTPESDSLWGTPGDDVLAGAGGDDWLEAGRGSDIYGFNIGDGHDMVLDNGAFLGGEVDRIEFGSGISPSMVTLSKQLLFGVYPSLVLQVNTGDSVSIVNYFGISPTSTPYLVEEIRFQDGTVWSDEDIAGHFPIVGTSMSEILGGLLIADVIFAGDGSDIVTARSGNDVVHGGPGNDRLEGGDGDDRLFGDEGDDILNAGVGWPRPGDNLLDGGPGDDVLDARSPGTDLMIGGPGNDRYLFGLGSGFDTMEDLGGNLDAVVIDAGISAEQVTGWHTDSHRVLALNDQDQLHIHWDPTTGLQIEEVRFADGTTWDVAALLDATATPAVSNQAPSLANPLPDQAALEDVFFGFTVAASTFVDPDPGDTLAYSATLVDGSPLPPWLTFDSAASLVSGTPAQADVGVLQIRVAVTDTAGLSAHDVFMLTVQPTNDAPVVSHPIDDQTAQEDTPFSLVLPASLFLDIDPADTLRFSATLADGSALPAWLIFNVQTGSFSGTPGNADVGETAIRITATDVAGEAATDVFALQVTNVNDAPVVTMQIGDQAVDAEAPCFFTIPNGTFADVDAGDSLNLSATLADGSALPAWLTFDPESQTLFGMPTTADIGIVGVSVQATDASAVSVSSEFTLTVRAVAGSSVSGGAGDDVIAGGTGDETLSGGAGDDALFGDVGDDVLRGGRGNDVLQGGEGDDILRAGTDGNLLGGGAGDDTIFDGSGDGFISGGQGNDAIHTGTGNDVIAFNGGDGWDTIYGGGDGGNTLSLGGGIDYADLSFSRSGDDLLLSTGNGDGMAFKDWYAGNKSILNLQIIEDAIDEADAALPDALRAGRVQNFDFLALARAFDESHYATPGLTSWALTNALLEAHLWASDDDALGGDLAYWYARNRLTAFNLRAAQQVLGAESFGSDAQSLRPFSGLQEGLIKLAA
jgi:Ca2+-binding RTX toxin-like protein